MKRLVPQLLILSLFFMVPAVQADHHVPDSYHGVTISAHSIHDLMPSLPHAAKLRVQQWLAQGGKLLVDQLAQFDDPSRWQLKLQNDLALLQNAGYENLSSTSYVVRIPDTPFLFKIAGPKYRVLGMLATKGVYDESLLENDNYLHRQILQRLGHEGFATYHTAGRAAYYLLIKQLLEAKKPFQYVAVPRTYLMYIPGHKKDASDNNVMLIQEFVPGQTLLKKRPELIALLPNRAIDELYEVVVATGLWNIKDNLLVSKDGQLVFTNGLNLTGFEEYPNTSSKDFFHRNAQRFYKNQALGIKSLMQLFASDPAKVNYIKSIISSDNRLCHCGRKCGFFGSLFNRNCGCTCQEIQELLDFVP